MTNTLRDDRTEVDDIGPKKCKCGKADSGFCRDCNGPCPACSMRLHNGICVYCDGKDYSDM